MNGPHWFAAGARAVNLPDLKPDAVAIVLPEASPVWRFAVVQYDNGVPFVFAKLDAALGWFGDAHGKPGRLVLIDPAADNGPASGARAALCGAIMSRSYASGPPGSIRSDIAEDVHADPWSDVTIGGTFRACELRALLSVHDAAARCCWRGD
jgi:hypothetical protein